MSNKSQLTQQLLEQLGIDPRPQLDQAMRDFWYNVKADGSWRLTQAGHDALVSLGFDQHTFDVPNRMPVIPRHLLILDRKLTQPYFIRIGKRPGLTLFGSREAMMYAMYGNLDKFLTYLQRT
jgi:hypothetical protein